MSATSGIIVGRPINGISLNGDEYLLDGNGKDIIFSTIAEAKPYLQKSGITSFDSLNFIKV